MALLRYRLGRDINEDGNPVYVVTDHGEPDVTDEDDGEGGTVSVATYTEAGAVEMFRAPYTPEGKAECQFRVLQGNAIERDKRQGNAQPVAANEPTDNGELGSAAITTAATGTEG